MGINDILLTVAALFPAVALMIYVFVKDRVEKEPLGLLAKLFLFGILACVPVVLVGTILELIADTVFSVVVSIISLNGIIRSFYNFVNAFICVALVEEGTKWLFLFLGTKNNREFDSLFDGIVYAVFVSLGFAALENLLYVFNEDGGWSVAIMRAVLSVPGHAFFGVLMGYYYSFWHVTDKAAMIEKVLKKKGVIEENIPELSSKKYAFLSLILPVLAHGFFDFCLFEGNIFLVIVYLAFVAFLYVFCIGKIRKMSKADSNVVNYGILTVLKKYPGKTADIKCTLFPEE